MLKNAFKPPNRLYSCAVIGLLLLMLTALALFAAAGLQSWETERKFDQQRDAFRDQYRLWDEQNIRSYTVGYTNCNYLFCCQNATLTVAFNIRRELDPECDQSTNSGYAWDLQVRTMDELYFWIDDRYRFETSWESLEIEFHPELHYITYLKLIEWQGATPIEISYQDLTVRP